MCLIAPNSAIGLPNCLRVAAYRALSPIAPIAAAHAHRAELEAPEVQHVEGDLVSLADLAEQVGGGNARILQDERRRRRAVQPHLVLFVARAHARESALDDEGGEVLAVDLGEHDEDVGEAAVGDPHLLAGQREAAVGQPDRAGGGAERIGSRPRLAQRIGADHLAGDQLRQIARLLIGACRSRGSG